jgi:hypothetical protein
VFENGHAGGGVITGKPDMEALAQAISLMSNILGFDHPALIRKAILAGTSPKGAEGLAEIPQTLQAGTKKSEETKRNLKDVLFFTDTEEGKAAGAAFLKRINNHTVDPEKPTSDAATGGAVESSRAMGQRPFKPGQS